MQYIYPKRIVKSEGNFIGEKQLFTKKVLQIGLKEPQVLRVKGGGYLILDFGEELSGGVRILTHRLSVGGCVRLRFGESIGETCAEIGHKNATNDHSLRDFSVELKDYSDMTFGQTGFRFLRVDFFGDEFSIKAIVAASDGLTRRENGSFTSSDELLNRIWATAAKTLKLCVRNGHIVDGVKRDRLVWSGDMYPEIKSAHCLFRRTAEVKNSLEFCRNQVREGEWMNDIPLYSVWWLYSLCEYCERNGDYAYAKKCLPFIKQTVNAVLTFVDENGDTHFVSDFIDWPTSYEFSTNENARNDVFAGTNYLIRLAFTRLIALLKKINAGGAVLSEAELTVARVNKKSYAVKMRKQIAALGILAGENQEQNEQLILSGGASGLSTFLNYFIFTALAKRGKHAEAINLIREYYGKMLQLGATTFWEDFNVEWAKNAYGIDVLPVDGKQDIHGDFGGFCYEGYRHSLCHGWASGVLAYMSENILGVQMVGGDNTKYTVSPKLGDLTFVNGKYPTVYGDIEVSAKRLKNGSLSVKISAPKEITVIES